MKIFVHRMCAFHVISRITILQLLLLSCRCDQFECHCTNALRQPKAVAGMKTGTAICLYLATQRLPPFQNAEGFITAQRKTGGEGGKLRKDIDFAVLIVAAEAVPDC